MATKKSQRIFIWFITALMIVGTVVSFVVLILSSKNQQSDQERFQQLSEQYQKDSDAQAKKLSDTYYDDFKQYESVPASFEKSDAKKLETKDLKVGDGKTLKKDDVDYAAYYIGWLPSGKIFDQSIENNMLNAPLDPSQGTVEGFTKGVVGMKIGGVRQLTIPAKLAYGEAGSGDTIPPNTPIKFIVMTIKKPEPVPIPPELLQLYQQQSTQQ